MTLAEVFRIETSKVAEVFFNVKIALNKKYLRALRLILLFGNLNLRLIIIISILEFII